MLHEKHNNKEQQRKSIHQTISFAVVELHGNKRHARGQR
jgi:hypothetical protein